MNALSVPKGLKRIVSGFRSGLIGNRGSDNWCWMTCAPLQSYLSMLGIETRLVEGELFGFHHFWLELDNGTVIDPTIDQFQCDSGIIRLPKVYIGPRKDWYKETL